jgi:bifunctional pyridoxal-dependent enzyme with beta-cystathionase and maltose regulon repressor activities
MNRLNKAIFLLFLISMTAGSARSRPIHHDDTLDAMVDFAYPISMMQSIRQDLNQALYGMQQQNFQSVAPLLQDALSKLHTRVGMNSDDVAYIQAMIDQIHALIVGLEYEQDRSLIDDMCLQIQKLL